MTSLIHPSRASVTTMLGGLQMVQAIIPPFQTWEKQELHMPEAFNKVTPSPVICYQILVLLSTPS
jgi:hypothetical protein